MSTPIVFALDALGIAIMLFGAVRAISAPRLAARRASAPAAGVPDNRALYIRGLTDFYRISGGLTCLAGMILVLVLNLAR